MTASSCAIVWDDEDWGDCFRTSILNTALPLLLLAASLLVLLVTFAPSLFPSRPSKLHRVVLPPADTTQVRLRPSVPVAPIPSTTSRAALAVFKAENAVIIQETVATPLREAGDVQRRVRRYNVAKRAIEVLASIALAATHFAAWAMGYQSSLSAFAWAMLWLYTSLLCAYTLTTSHSLFRHKAPIFTLYWLIALSNLRTAVLNRSSAPQAVLTLATVQAVFATVVVVPTYFFPFSTRLPRHLRALHENVVFPDDAPTKPTPGTSALPTPPPGEAEPVAVEPSAEVDVTVQPVSKVILPPTPEEPASMWSRALFGFVTPEVLLRYRTPFSFETVPDLRVDDRAAAVLAAFRSQSSKRRRRHQRSSKTDGVGADTEPDTLEDEVEALEPSDDKLSIRLLRHFQWDLVAQVVCSACDAIFILSSPFFLRLILQYIAQRSRSSEDAPPLHMALLYVAGMFLGVCFHSISASQALWIGRRVCIRLRAILITEIVTKALRRKDVGSNKRKGSSGAQTPDPNGDDDSVSGKKAAAGKGEDEEEDEDGRATDGRVVNLTAVDTFKASEVAAYLHFLFPSCPLTIFLCIVFLTGLLGWSAIAGLVVLLLSLPVQTINARKFVHIQNDLLAATDQRLAVATEVLNAIKTVKFFSWEESFYKRMNETRRKELDILRRRFMLWMVNGITLFGTPVVATVVTFAFHTKVLHHPLPAEVAFTALALFQTIRSPLDTFTDQIVWTLSALVSVNRIDKFLREPETEKYTQLQRQMDDSDLDPGRPVIGFRDATFSYAEDADADVDDGETFMLRDLNLSFPVGQLSIVAGPVGSGKTSLLMGLLGEIRQLRGRTFMPCVVSRQLEPADPKTGLKETVAYCSQSAWLLGTTVKENIVFGSPWNEDRYKAVLHACALEPDLKVFENGDETEVGEKGTACSGGQRARIALARALYSSARHLLIDDALSAVDAHTAQFLYENFLKGPLAKGRTIILVTHAVGLCLPGAAFAVAMDEGRVVAAGTPEEVKARGLFADEVLADDTAGHPSKQPIANDAPPPPADADAVPLPGGGASRPGPEEPAPPPPTIEQLDGPANEEEEAQKKKQKAKLVEEEEYAQGAVASKAYALYFNAVYPTVALCAVYWLLLIFLFLISRAADIGESAWLRKWAASYDDVHTSVQFRLSRFVMAVFVQSDGGGGGGVRAQAEDQDQTVWYLSVYLAIGVFFVALIFVRDGTQYYGSLRASQRLYDQLIRAILSAKPTWFDKTPVGRIMNRLTKDTETIDQDLAPSVLFLIDSALSSLAVLLVVIYATPLFIFAAVLIIAIYWIIGSLYISSSRDLKRIESVARSPIYTLVGEVLGGVVSVRAYGDAARFTRKALRLIDGANRPFLFMWLENRWLSIRVDIAGALVSFFAAMFLLLKTDVDPALAGFSLSYSISFTEHILWVVRLYSQVELNMNSVERIAEYLEVESEKQGGDLPPAYWPSSTSGISVEGLSVRYAPQFSQVLKKISFEVKPMEKIGIVGRTGSGKSTLTLAFFRFLEAEEGRIVIDGIDIGNLHLSALRSRLTLIPQHPDLFKGTVRSNLDPFGAHEDSELWDALIKVGMATPAASRAASRSASRAASRSASRAASRTPSIIEGHTGEEEEEEEEEDGSERTIITSLEQEVEQNGKNFSTGQKQLLALARGLLKLRDSRILILDESTANLDHASDEQIQKTIRQEMAPQATILTIAHRLRTVIYDRILVLDKGTLVEYDTPANLLRTDDSVFSELCRRSGEYELLKKVADGVEVEKRR